MRLTDALMEAVQSLPDKERQKVNRPLQSGLSALLEQWRQEDSTTNDDEIPAAQAELDEFKQNLNANRAATGERLLFP